MKIDFEGKFRGKNYTHFAANGGWVYGKLRVEKYHYIVDLGCFHIVPYKSVGCSTGCFDLKGNEIFQDDFIEYGVKNKKIYRVNSDDFVKRVGSDFKTRIVKFLDGAYQRRRDRVICHVIGNVFDNPELLECCGSNCIEFDFSQLRKEFCNCAN